MSSTGDGGLAMARFLGQALAAGLILGMASKSDAQVAVSIGNPFLGRGVYVGAPAYGYVPPPVVGGVYVGAPVVPPVYAGPPVVGLGVGVYPRYPVYRPYYGPRYHSGPYRRW
jgi:hypothetical protein